ncbi:hypothetical protein [Chitinophaga sp.]|uniref:hypothetical protein n=1 Tax=Chitinophaga sp. TaxID=1869181 RepID=UPI002C721BF0|nr:hypothetical protein [Chitinophaga sp.]HWV67865.1 hypothetical protein [Chitinophaga sp.]
MKTYIGLFIITVLAACAGNSGHETPAQGDSSMAATQEEVQYDTSLVINRRDPVCRMPIRAGIYDTAHIKGVVIGFCSTACKDSFLLNPAAYTLITKSGYTPGTK